MSIPELRVKVSNVHSGSGNDVANQFLIEVKDEGVFFQSYKSIIAWKPYGGQIVLDKDKWDYSVTTGKYRNLFLRETKKETEKKIKDGVYLLANLN